MPRRRHFTKQKISQKVIQKVIVKVGEERKAKKARRRYRRTNKDVIIDQLQNELVQQRVLPNVVYQTQQPFVPMAKPTRNANALPEFVPIENAPSEPFYVPTKKEQLETFETPVPAQRSMPLPPQFSLQPIDEEPISSRIFTAQLNPNQRVDGNFAFGMPDPSDRHASSLYDSDVNLQDIKANLRGAQPRSGYMSVASETEAEAEPVAKPVRKRRSQEELLLARKTQLQFYLEKEGMPQAEAIRYIEKQDPRDLQKLITKHKPKRKPRGG